MKRKEDSPEIRQGQFLKKRASNPVNPSPHHMSCGSICLIDLCRPHSGSHAGRLTAEPVQPELRRDAAGRGTKAKSSSGRDSGSDSGIDSGREIGSYSGRDSGSDSDLQTDVRVNCIGTIRAGAVLVRVPRHSQEQGESERIGSCGVTERR
ncbi:GL11570 [Drosophila persimilis]|uniref:GL11570 n=1 Tax=Drosophila persimilis TaxID=7234 RepID=B4GBQ4_DROPE|nr:GL11570 [Drosophila persimilis]